MEPGAGGRGASVRVGSETVHDGRAQATIASRAEADVEVRRADYFVDHDALTS